ncbi:signal transduction diguanylate cyclase [Oleiphilus messinensis]|uniref:diguanylate cyclase n=2 Tax=Oleiphilus messinensis TaxID=141451 RepID=A0A1Y0I6T4_9GAMM|nr:signal transduction diguanylate cyclase [Oleiphilus messinensis]
MDRLTIPAKFVLVMAFFAVPLAITSIQNIVTMQSSLSLAEKRRVGVELQRSAFDMVKRIEIVRDLSVFSRNAANQEINHLFEQNRAEALQMLMAFEARPEVRQNQLLKLSVSSLIGRLQTFRASSGSEGDMIGTIYGSAHSAVAKAYSLQQEIANEFDLSTDNDFVTEQLLGVLSDSLPKSYYEMGKARGFGVYFLETRLMNSSGIKMLEETYVELWQAHEQLENSFHLLITSQGGLTQLDQIDYSSLNSVLQTRQMLDDYLLLDVDLQAEWRDYYDSVTQQIGLLHAVHTQLLDFLSARYSERILQKRESLLHRSVSIGVLVLFTTYLFVGFYLSIRNSIGLLVNAANRVAEGDLEEKVAISAKDEMLDIAEMMDEMRQQLRDRELQLVAMTITDGLTRVCNRAFFNQELPARLEKSRRADLPVCLLLIDIDYFKKLNDSYGHQVGDDCLIMVAQAIKGQLLREEDSVSRYGGEEFAVILPATDSLGGLATAERILSAIRRLKLELVGGQVVTMTASIGVASSAAVEQCSDDRLVALADESLYKAKHDGRNRCIVYKK